MKKQKHRSEQNIWRIRKNEKNLYDGWNILGERTAREGKLIIQKMEAVTWGRFIWKVQIIRETLAD